MFLIVFLPVGQLCFVAHYGTVLYNVLCSGVNCNWTCILVVPKKYMIFVILLSASWGYYAWTMCGSLNGLPLWGVIWSVYCILQSAIFWKLKDRNWSQYGVVDVVTRLWAGWSAVSFSAGARDFLLSKRIQISSRTQPKSCSMGTRFFFQ